MRTLDYSQLYEIRPIWDHIWSENGQVFQYDISFPKTPHFRRNYKQNEL